MLPAGTKLDLDMQTWTVEGELPGSDSSGFATAYLATDESGSN